MKSAMMLKTSRPDTSYLHFIHTLEVVLKKSGITPFRQSIRAAANRKEGKTGADQEMQTTIGRVVIYIEEHLSEPLSLGELAEEASTSKYQLIRSFRDAKGITPWKFLIAKRIEKVKKLLENGTPPGQAAVETGFYDQSHLNKAFKEETGRTPKKYQEENFKNRN